MQIRKILPPGQNWSWWINLHYVDTSQRLSCGSAAERRIALQCVFPFANPTSGSQGFQVCPFLKSAVLHIPLRFPLCSEVAKY